MELDKVTCTHCRKARHAIRGDTARDWYKIMGISRFPGCHWVHRSARSIM